MGARQRAQTGCGKKFTMLLGGKRPWYWYGSNSKAIESLIAGVSQSVKRGYTIVQQKGYNLIDP